MSVRVEVKAELFRWALRRAGYGESAANERFPYLRRWLGRERLPTLRQLQDFAAAVHVPLALLLLPRPPVDDSPVPDFRSRAGTPPRPRSPDLDDTIRTAQIRQAWYREFARRRGHTPTAVLGAATRISPVAGRTEPETAAAMTTATAIADALARPTDRHGPDDIRQLSLTNLVDRAEDLGILVSVSSIVGGATSRRLDPDEFSGFALVDDYAPFIFINGADSKPAQRFTLIHELAHLWAGYSALSNTGGDPSSGETSEPWCNRVAAEVLVPAAALAREFRCAAGPGTLTRLAASFGVSTLVVLLRLVDGGLISRSEFRVRYARERERVSALVVRRRDAHAGGNHCAALPRRLGRRFARAVIMDTLEGGTAYGEAFRLLGTARTSTFHRLAQELAVA